MSFNYYFASYLGKPADGIGCDYAKAISPDAKTWEERALISVIGLNNWAKNYVYRGTNKFTKPLFLRKYKKED